MQACRLAVRQSPRAFKSHRVKRREVRRAIQAMVAVPLIKRYFFFIVYRICPIRFFLTLRRLLRRNQLLGLDQTGVCLIQRLLSRNQQLSGFVLHDISADKRNQNFGTSCFVLQVNGFILQAKGVIGAN